MKVLLINGSSRSNGCTFTALSEIANVLEENGISSEIIQVGNRPVNDCIACGKCKTLDNACIFNIITCFGTAILSGRMGKGL